jgi:general secretion pathway protein D
VNVRGKRVSGAILLLASVAMLPSCSTYKYTRRANEAMRVQNWDAAVYYYLEALAQDPGNIKYKMELARVRMKAAEDHFRRGMRFKESGVLERAKTEFEMAVQLDPTHQYAEQELAKVRKDLAILSQEGGAAKLAEMKKEAAEMKVKPPILNPASNEPMTLSFPNQTNVKDIYRAIGQAFGINILFDPKLRDTKLSIELRNVTAREALESVMQAAGHFYKVLDPKTVIVAEDTPQNRRDYEDLVVKTFYLSNADVKDINNMLRALIDARRIATNEQLNSVVIRDTADKVAIAERLIDANDKAKAEVLVDVQLIQVDSNKLRDIGTELSNYSPVFTVDPTQLGGNATSGAVPLSNIGDITRSMWSVVLPTLTVNLIKSAGEAETLAQPELRITEGQKGSLVIGNQQPIPTTTFNTSTTIGTSVVPITAFQYKDVGIKIEIEPRVHHNNEVTLKLKIEASEFTGNTTLNGQTMPTFGTRNIDSVIRLKDGETSLLAGLIKYNKTTSTSGLPFLSDIPLIGPLFRDNYKNYTRTDLVLTLTPHIIRNPDITEQDLAPLWVGTENRITIFGNSPRVRSAVGGNPLGDNQESGIRIGNETFPLTGNENPEGVNPQGGEGTQPGARGPRLAVPPRQPVQPGQPTAVPNEPPPPEPPGTEPQPGMAANAGAAPATGQGTLLAGGSVPGASSQGMSATAAVQSPTASEGLSALTFYPARLPLLVGKEGDLTVVLDPGPEGVDGPLHLAYDPTKLEVTQIQGGELPGPGGKVRADVTHDPTLGWITVGWKSSVIGSGTLVRLTVRPRQAGEAQVIFAGPVGEVVSHGATVVALPAPVVEAPK